MSAHRPYREPLSVSQIRTELARGRGRQWEPRLIDIALEMIDTGVMTFGDHGVLVSTGDDGPHIQLAQVG